MESAALPTETAEHHCPRCHGAVFLNRWFASGDIPCPHCRQLLWFVCKPVEGAIVLTLLPGLMAGSESMQRFDEIAAAAAGAVRVIVDLSQVRLVTSMVLRMLVLLHKRINQSGGTLRLCGVSSDGEEVFRVTKLDTVFGSYADEEAARLSP